MIDNKPIITYTMECFENHPDIDIIVVVCVKGWEDTLRAAASGITKLCHIIPGGDSGHQSIRNGVMLLWHYYSRDDIVLIHDAVRPIVSRDVITNCLYTVRKYGNATCVIPCPEVMLYSDNRLYASNEIPRDNLKRTQTPQGFYLGDLYDLHSISDKEYIASCSMFIDHGRNVYFSPGDPRNIKLTTDADLDLIKYLLHEKK